MSIGYSFINIEIKYMIPLGIQQSMLEAVIIIISIISDVFDLFLDSAS